MQKQGRFSQWLPAALGCAMLALTTPAVGFAQQAMNAQSLTAKDVTPTAAELGPEWSQNSAGTRTVNGIELYVVTYSSPAGRVVKFTTGIGPADQNADELITFVRRVFEDAGETIISVQSQGYGDGRAFKSQVREGPYYWTSYMFRVKNLFSLVEYRSSANSADADQQAGSFARKQEGKMFATLAPPPPPTPTPAPAAPVAQPMPTPAPAAIAQPVAAPPVLVAGDPYCAPGEKPQFRFGFATLAEQIGGAMGTPTSCEYADPRGSGDTLQATSTGLGFYRRASNMPTFTTGFEHWALTSTGAVYWTGESIDPPETAQPVLPG